VRFVSASPAHSLSRTIAIRMRRGTGARYSVGIVQSSLCGRDPRTAFMAAEWFLKLNSRARQASDEDCVLVMLELAPGPRDGAAFAAWTRSRWVKA